MKKLKSTIRVAERLAEARKDVRRMNWLADGQGRYIGKIFSGEYRMRNFYGGLIGEGKTLREAIDAAMAKERKR